jgi:hypothetical protein
MSTDTREIFEENYKDKELYYRELSCTAYGFYHCCLLISIFYVVLSTGVSLIPLEPSVYLYINIYLMSLILGVVGFLNRYFEKLKQYKGY